MTYLSPSLKYLNSIPYIYSPLSATFDTASLSVTLPSGVGYINGNSVAIPAVSLTAASNTIYDYQLGSNGVFTTQTVAASNYTAIVRYPDKLHVWQVQTGAAGVSALKLMADTYPVIQRQEDRARTADQFIEYFYLNPTTIAWAPTTSAVYGTLLATATGKVYQVIVAGTTGGSAPTSTATGNITDGSATLQYYGISWYLGMFRYAQNNGLEWYFTGIGLIESCHRIAGAGQNIITAGTEFTALIKTYLQKSMLHVVAPRLNSQTYQLGMKVTVDGWIWECTTAGATAANTNAFTSGQPHSVGQLITDSVAVWTCIYQYFGAAQWFWMNVDRTFQTYTYPDSHDSYASVFLSLMARYIKLTGDSAWLLGPSPQPGLTYQTVLTNIYNYNLANSISNNLTQTFQGNIAPWDGSAFTTQYLEDNCESYTAFDDSIYLFSLLSDATTQANAIYCKSLMASGIYNLFDTNFNIFAYYYGADVSTYYNDPNVGFYAAMQAQLWPELHGVSSILEYMKQSARLWMSQRWNNWWADKGRDTLPFNLSGFIYARLRNDAAKAYTAVENAERYFLTDGSMIIQEFAYYLNTKDALASPYQILKIANNKINIQTPALDIINVPFTNVTLGPAALNLTSTTAVKLGVTSPVGRFLPLEVILLCTGVNGPTGIGAATMGVGISAVNYNETFFSPLSASFNTANQVYRYSLPLTTTAFQSYGTSSTVYAKMSMTLSSGSMTANVYLRGFLST